MIEYLDVRDQRFYPNTCKINPDDEIIIPIECEKCEYRFHCYYQDCIEECLETL